jgi:hypothetical protein
MWFFFSFVYICYSKKQNLCTNLFKNFIQAGHMSFAIINSYLLMLCGFSSKKEFTEILKTLFWADRYTYSIVSWYGFVSPLVLDHRSNG